MLIKYIQQPLLTKVMFVLHLLQISWKLNKPIFMNIVLQFCCVT